MKKTAFAILLLLITFTSSMAQMHVGVGGKVSVPLEFAYFISLGGAGGNISAGYLFKNRLDITISAENVWFISPDKIKTTTYQAGIKYMVLSGFVKPYIGLGAAYLRTSMESEWMGKKSRGTLSSGMGYVPVVGALFNSEWIKGLWINPEFSYYYTIPTQKLKPINLSICFIYFIKCNKKAEKTNM